MKRLCFSFKFVIQLIAAVQISVTVFTSATADEDFGRFFTTPMQRQYLDQLKNRGKPIVVNIEEDLSAVEQTTRTMEEVNDAITVKGLVYRKSGKSAAWVNNSNSFEGDITSGYSEISENKITSSDVNINIGNQNQVIRLKVGQKYEPATNNIRDITGKTDSKITVKRP